MFKSEVSFNRMAESTASELSSRVNGNVKSDPKLHTNGNHLSVYPPPPPSSAANGNKHPKNNGDSKK
jgi:hypothetical protein